jgi:hypothetical protein
MHGHGEAEVEDRAHLKNPKNHSAWPELKGNVGRDVEGVGDEA